MGTRLPQELGAAGEPRPSGAGLLLLRPCLGLGVEIKKEDLPETNR